MPVSKERFPSRMAASISSVPTTRSSVALTGSSTTFMGSSSTSGALPSYFSWHSSHHAAGASGSSWNRQPLMQRRGGSRSASARTAVDFAVPFSPWINTPPSRGFTTLSTSACFIFSCPMMAVKGNVSCLFINSASCINSFSGDPPPQILAVNRLRRLLLTRLPRRGTAPVISPSFRRWRSTSSAAPPPRGFRRYFAAPRD